MIKRELKVNLKSFIIWTNVLIGIYLVVFLIYPSISDGENINQINEMMKMFPNELLKAFNMDISSMETVYGWLKSEGFIFILLIIGSYAGILGSNILLKEESDKTSEYLNSLPIKRKTIVLNKVIVGVLYIILITFIIGLFNYIGLLLSSNFDKKSYFLLSISPIFSSLVIFFICLYISTFFKKASKMIGISIGLVFISYVFSILGEMSKTTEFLKYISVFTLSDIRNIIKSISINPIMIVFSIIISVIFLTLTLIRYDKKEAV